MIIWSIPTLRLQLRLNMDLPASQGSSHFTPEPISGSVLADREVKRRNAAVRLGLCRTGCLELDDYVLLGGLERGSVVGLSAEDEEVGVQVSKSNQVTAISDQEMECFLLTEACV